MNQPLPMQACMPSHTVVACESSGRSRLPTDASCLHRILRTTQNSHCSFGRSWFAIWTTRPPLSSPSIASRTDRVPSCNGATADGMHSPTRSSCARARTSGCTHARHSIRARVRTYTLPTRPPADACVPRTGLSLDRSARAWLSISSCCMLCIHLCLLYVCSAPTWSFVYALRWLHIIFFVPLCF